ncbi:MAG: methylmalonyl-CoA epimerase [Planctomycetota bacterium]
MPTHIRHLGIAVHSLEEALPLWRDLLGLELRAIEEVPAEKVRVAILDAGGPHIELLEPTAPDAAIARFLDTRGPGIHHLALGVGDVAEASSRLQARGLELIGAIARPGAGGTRVSFVHPRSTGGILLELVDGGAGEGGAPRE